MGTTAIDAGRVAELAKGFRGEILRPGEEGYEERRQVHNGMVDRRPGLIARPTGAEDVAAALRLARDLGLPVSVRGGGHNVAGRAVCDDGVMIDLSGMRRVDVDAGARRATAQGGTTWADLNEAAAAHGLAVTGGAISTTGVAGLTLGGGLGWLMSKYGLAADNLVGVELVTADGKILQVDDDSEPDPMWALRGGGGNFGVPCRSPTGSTPSRPSSAASSPIRSRRPATCSGSTATPRRRARTT
jgi:FAD/FMN-containing dehydrogenase